MTKKTRRAKARRALLTLSLVLVMMMVAVGGTIAWLTDSTEPVTNVFNAGDVEITLTENEGEIDDNGNHKFTMVPGNTIAKDPLVTVLADSEAAWVFVKIEKLNNFDAYMTYSVADGWTALTGVEGVYYRKVDASDVDQEFAVLADNQVVVKQNVTSDMMETANNTNPTITFTAYAIQQANIADDATAAWDAIQNPPAVQ